MKAKTIQINMFSIIVNKLIGTYHNFFEVSIVTKTSSKALRLSGIIGVMTYILTTAVEIRFIFLVPESFNQIMVLVLLQTILLFGSGLVVATISIIYEQFVLSRAMFVLYLFYFFLALLAFLSRTNVIVLPTVGLGVVSTYIYCIIFTTITYLLIDKARKK